MRDYAAEYASFSYDTALAERISGRPDAMNACVECCDRHVAGERVALGFEGVDGTSASITFAELKARAAQFAGFLRAQGIGPGDRVAGLLPRTPELLVTMLGTWRAGAVYQPLFTAFGPKAIEHRITTSRARLVVTDTANRSKLAELASAPAVLTVRRAKEPSLPSGGFDFVAELAKQSTELEPVARSAEDAFVLMFTSGTTGPAKSLEVPLRAIAAFVGYLRDAADLRPEDVFWNLADPGWAYGLYYAAIGPLAMGHATTFYEGRFTAEDTCRVIEKRGVTNLAGSPTAFRMLMAGGEDVAKRLRGKLRVVSSAGEPLNPEVIRWFSSQLGVTVHDHYGQTELGMVLCNHHALAHPVHLGAAGVASPGHRVVVMSEEGAELPDGQPGILALDRNHSPMMWFRGYEGAPRESVERRYYETGDSAEKNPDGTISFIGRSDDVITTSGYRVGPFDVESALIEHPAVVEAAVIGKPDPDRTEVIKAFVVLGKGFSATKELAEELRVYVRDRLAAHAYPREIEFVADLPKTPSGKVQRFLLRNAERAKLAPPEV